MVLDLKDKRILFELDKNSRQPYSVIAKKVGLSKETCIYRINKLKKDGIIKQFSTKIALNNLGLSSYKIYLQLHGLNEEKKKEMINSLKSNKKINWMAECVGNYDLILAVLCRDIKEFNEEKNEIIQSYSEYIQDYKVGIMSETHIYERSYLINKNGERESFLIGKLSEVKIDEKDKDILKLLSSDSRIQTIELAEKAKLNVKTIISKIKKLEEKNIIQGYNLNLDLNKIDYKFYKIFIHLDKPSKDEIKKFLSFCKSNKNIIFLVENVGLWEFEPEFEIESEDEFYEIVNKMKTNFPELIKNIETIRIVKEHKADYCPTELI